MDLNEVLQRLQGVKGSGNQYTALCPAHEDSKPSLSVAVGSDGRILLKCHAGCTVEAVVAAMGLSMSDLCPEPNESLKKPKKVVTTYSYCDLNDNCCEKIRYDDKTFGWRQRNERGDWVYNKNGIKELLYNREILDSNDTVFIVEGEKDVDTLKARDLPAVCSANGAGRGKWPHKLNHLFEGKSVYVLNDNDEVGRQFAKGTADSLCGVAKFVKLLEVTKLYAGLPDHGDITDVFERLGDEALSALAALAQSAHEHKKAQNGKPQGGTVSATELVGKEFTPLLQPVNQLICEGLTFLVGASKIGKSWIALLLAVCVARGSAFWGRVTMKSRVLYFALEDSERRIKSRLLTMGETNPPENLMFATQAEIMGEGFEGQLSDWLSGGSETALIIIDTFQKVRGISPRGVNAYQADYETVGKLKSLADKHRAAIVCIHHTNKLRNAADPYEKISGSTGIMGAADTAILIDRERGSDLATVMFTGRDVYGDDFIIRFNNGRWDVEHENAAEFREGNAYEAEPMVQLLRSIVTTNPTGSKWAYSQLESMGLDLLGYPPFATARDCASKLGQLSQELLRRDGILVSCGLTINKGEYHGKGIKIEVKQPITKFQAKFDNSA